ncbi:Uncharacterized protein TPAR_06376 [Tolypocladium paradoxum]|uniref:Ubiquitin-like domain-containing protein n=1 Tax=Tolypocladium paradoxum TaxID=94208 RepID=A0A2S4KTC2_9HYPO|nr:Uncharacterized protein TPAR_06376 [Tolypocladium paradoxum]
MATEPSTSQPEGAAVTPPEQLVVNLQVVSPSVGVNRPLLFPDLPATTTIKRLKDMIRQALPLRPADENQRLIHRGRALLCESDSLLDIFGVDALRAPDRQTIHLVIRDVSDSQTPTPSAAARGPSPVDGGQSTNAPRVSHSPHPPHPHFGQDPQPPFARRAHFQTTVNSTPQLRRLPSPVPAHHTPEQAAAFQQHHQNMTNWLSQVQRDAHLQREAMVRAFVSQNQRGRAQMGMRGIGDIAGNVNGVESNNGRASPGASHSVHYESVGPNGQSYHVDTVIRAATQGSQAGLSPTDVQNIIRGADANQATMAMANAMQRSASGTSIHNRPLTQPGVTTPVLGAGGSLAGSGRATPDLEPRSAGAGNNTMASGSLPSQPQRGLQVYILSSPEGPRALLLNTSAAETYYSPRLRTQASLSRLRSNATLSSVTFASQAHSIHGAQQHDQRPQVQHEPPAAVHAQAPVQHVHPNNPPAAGLPPLLMWLWPHIWLILRLGLFVWFCTAPDSSWSRWFTVICLAVFMFVLSTGLLNAVAENAWRPIGRHLENLLPDLEHMQGGQGAVLGQGQEGQPAGREGGVGPEQLAARLVDEHRAREGWLTGQVRRLERAGLLFLASIAPGVAERHIANLEAEARAEENRRREAEAAAAAAAAAAASTTGEEGNNNSGNRNETNTREDDNTRPEEQLGGNEHQEAPRGNLGEVPIREELIAL